MKSGRAGVGGSASAHRVGMLLAFIGYKGQVSGEVFTLLNDAVEIKMLSLHVERLGDIVLGPVEKDSVPFNDLA
jgi:ATP-binding cassette, subfamily B, bacterial CvaB/MchF/RaxB